jgi:hypothetical protein
MRCSHQGLDSRRKIVQRVANLLKVVGGKVQIHFGGRDLAVAQGMRGHGLVELRSVGQPCDRPLSAEEPIKLTAIVVIFIDKYLSIK